MTLKEKIIICRVTMYFLMTTIFLAAINFEQSAILFVGLVPATLPGFYLLSITCDKCNQLFFASNRNMQLLYGPIRCHSCGTKL